MLLLCLTGLPLIFHHEIDDLLGHDQWQADLAASPDGLPGQAGYGLIAWLVLHAGWQAWLDL